MSRRWLTVRWHVVRNGKADGQFCGEEHRTVEFQRKAIRTFVYQCSLFSGYKSIRLQSVPIGTGIVCAMRFEECCRNGLQSIWVVHIVGGCYGNCFLGLTMWKFDCEKRTPSRSIPCRKSTEKHPNNFCCAIRPNKVMLPFQFHSAKTKWRRTWTSSNLTFPKATWPHWESSIATNSTHHWVRFLM